MLIRPELKHLKQITKLAEKCVKQTTNDNSTEDDLHDFLKSVLVNTNLFFEIAIEEETVKGFCVASLQKQVWSNTNMVNVAFLYCDPCDTCEQNLDMMFDNIKTWAKTNNAKTVMFTELEQNENNLPSEFKKIGSIYGVEV